MLGVVSLGLGAALAWGVSDLLGGLSSRRIHLLAVLIVSQAAGLTAVGVIAVLRWEGPPHGFSGLYAVLAGGASTIGLAALFRGMAVGEISVVAPITATSPVIPLAVGFAMGDRLHLLQAGGVVLAFLGVVFVSREPHSPPGRSWRLTRGAGMALIAAASGGGFFLAMGAASRSDTVWAILIQRGTSTFLLAVVGLFVFRQISLRAADLPILISIGGLDVAATVFFAAASNIGSTALAAVLAAMFPVVTVLLAHMVANESVSRVQLAGGACAMCGVALITVG